MRPPRRFLRPRSPRGLNNHESATPLPPSDSSPDIEFAWRVHTALQDWIKGVDTKSSITIVIVVGFSVFAANQVFAEEGSLYDSAGAQLWAIRIMGSALLFAALFALWAVFPVLKRRQAKRQAKDGLIYFGHLRYRSPSEIEGALLALDVDEIRKQLSRQLAVVSVIVWAKHARLQRAHVSLVISVVAFVLAQTAFD